MQDSRPMRYGDFPRLFEGFPPDEEVDLWDMRTILRLMRLAEAVESGAVATRAEEAPADADSLSRHG